MGKVFRLPLIPIFLAYGLGLLLGHLDFPLPGEKQGLLLLLIFFVVWTLFYVLRKTKQGSVFGLLFFFFLGVFSIYLYLHPTKRSSDISQFVESGRIRLEGIVDRPPHVSGGRGQILLRCREVILPDRRLPVNGRVLLFVEPEAPSIALGDRLRVWCTLHRPWGFHNPGGFQYERSLAFERIYAIGFLVEEDGWVKIGEPSGNPFRLRIEAWRDHIRRFLEKEAPPPSSALLKALVLGERGDIPEQVSEKFVATGIAHLLAISGDHLGIVALLSFSLFLWVLKRSEFILLSISVRKWAAGLTIPCILLYTFIAGAGISVLRATIMVIVFFFSILFNRERNLLHTLVVAAFLILFFSPPSLFDVSFQLSFIAVLSILYLIPRFQLLARREEPFFPRESSWRRKGLGYLKYSFLVTMVASLGTAPFVALHFNRLSSIGLVTNLLMIPWVGFLIVPLALVGSLFSFVFHPLATLVIQFDAWLIEEMLRVVFVVGSFRFSSFYVSTPTWLEILLFYGLLFSIVRIRKGRRWKYVSLGLGLALLLDLGFWEMRGHFQRHLALTVIDVGQGDAILVEFPRGKRMLIDGGGLPGNRFDTGRSVVAPVLWKKKIRRVDYLVLSHPDPDHFKGLNFIASHFSIGEFWDSGTEVASESYWMLKQTLKEKKIPRRSLDEATSPQSIGGVEISILNPEMRRDRPRLSPNPSWINNSSLVLKLRFESKTLLLPGDIEREAEERMVRKGYDLGADFLKVPHHGSLSSSTATFLTRVKPSYAVISVGRSRWGRLPNPEVVKRYEQLGTALFRTDRHGAVELTCDGRNLQVRPFRNLLKDQVSR